ncbi:uncharacterized protein LOC133814123 [Humulus lupulus]|uniref:uncharacterized protein LOC133814123 n=1 Tax=Humulus lupulus TaxID=3486 RepID=UPI002B417AFB|nr:uncharacterized protein LOC133814123 [Humulus lupulus]
MPNYVKFLKDILAKKRKLGKFETVALTEGCSAILKNKIPPKLKDPGSFTIPCSIGGRDVGRPLCHLGASINLMPMLIFKKLGIGKARPTIVTLQLADRFMAHPEGKIKDVLVQFDKFIFLADFIILNYEADRDVPIILELEDLSEEEESQVTWVELKQPFAKFRRPFESLDLSEGNFKPPKPSIQEPPKLELKPLPNHLKYAYLKDNETLPVIISAMLGAEKEHLLLVVLKKYTRAIGWSMANINDSSWVRPIQCVPKKGGVTVVANENNELIPTRQVSGWHVCMDYRKLNKATWKDHFLLPFIDQMLDRLAGKEFYCFLDGYSGYNQISIMLEDQEKTTFTCPYGTFAFRRMSFGLCNAPATFQRCMMAIFSDMVEKSLAVFIEDFSVFGESFDTYLANLEQVLARCEEMNLVLNWEKCHFMVQEGIVLGHRISNKGIAVDRAKLKVIEKLQPPTIVKGIRSFLGHTGFYRRFIKDFSKISKPLCSLLEQNQAFEFTKECQEAFVTLKKALITVPIIVAPHWSLPYELMCNASDFVVGVILGQRKEKDRKGTENQVVDHLSRLEVGSEKQNEGPIKETFPDEQFFVVNQVTTTLYADFVNYLVSGLQPPDLNRQQLEKLFHDVKFYYWDEPYLYKQCPDRIMRHFVPEDDVFSILEHCHSAPYSGHFGGQRTAAKVFQSGYYWPSIFKNAHEFAKRCDHCQSVGNISARSEMPLNSILEVEFFDV